MNNYNSLKHRFIEQPSWVIYTPATNALLGCDYGLGMFAGDGSDGKKEAFCFINFQCLTKELTNKFNCWQKVIIYPDEETVKLVLERIKDKIKNYFDINDLESKVLLTTASIEDKECLQTY